VAVLVKAPVLLSVSIAFLSLASSGSALEMDDFINPLTNAVSVSAYVQIDSAYISSGNSISDARQIIQQCVTLTKGFEEYGRLSAYIWQPSSLHGRNDESRRRAYYWMENGIYHAHSLRLNDIYSIYTRPLLFWGVPTGCRSERHSSFSTKFLQRFDNPWISPYYNFYGRLAPDSWWQISFGLMRDFKLMERLSLSPSLEFTYNDERRYKARYGMFPDSREDRWSSMVLRVTLKWWLDEHWNVYLSLKDYETMGHDNREIVKRQTSYNARNHLTACSLGLGCTF
jgi:hypothetical protein